MTPDDKTALKLAYPEHAFMRILHPLGEAILAVPRVQTTPEKTDAMVLWAGATVRIGSEKRK